MIQLHVLSGKKSGSRVTATRFPFRVGRAPKSDLLLDDDGVWDQHIALEFRKNEGFQMAAAPQAIAAVNATPTNEIFLRNGDVITLGSARLQFWLAPAPQRGLCLRENSVWALLFLVFLGEFVSIYLTLR